MKLSRVSIEVLPASGSRLTATFCSTSLMYGLCLPCSGRNFSHPRHIQSSRKEGQERQRFCPAVFGFLFLKGRVPKTAQHIIGQHLVTLPHLGFHRNCEILSSFGESHALLKSESSKTEKEDENRY